MKTFAEHFCLKDGRDNFFIDESRDSQLVLGSRKYKKTVDEMLDAAIASRRPPRLVWVGDFGVGKTHHINYTDNKISTEAKPFKVIRMDLPDVVDNSDFNVLFERMVGEIGLNFFKPLLVEQIQAEPKWLDTITPLDIKKALRQLALNEDVAESAWDFLCGRKLAKDERAQVGVSKLQLDDSEEFASVLQHIATVIRSRTPDHRVLLYLVDEVEGLGVVTRANAANKWILALRKILDITDIGIIFAIGSLSLNEIPTILTNGAIIRRFGNENYVVLQPFEINETKSFVQELLAQFVEPNRRAAVETKEKLLAKSDYDPAFYPFMKDAFEGYCEHLIGDTARAKPAQFQLKLHATLSAALKEDKSVIDRPFLEGRGEWQ
jgi:hypothetical protein